MFNDPQLRAFLIHVAAYVAVVATLGVINVITAPQNLWFFWVLMGWGVGVAAHDVALLLQKTRRRERIFIDAKARGFAVHLFVYVGVNLVLLAVNLIATPQVWWFYWVILGWGAGILAHAWCVFRTRRPAQAAPQAEPPVSSTPPEVKPSDA